MIDVRELHIGSHVRIGGKMHRVCAIDGLNEQIGIEAYKTDTDGVKHPFGYKIGDITPIPLTEELLTEIGFEKTNHVCVWRKSFNHSLLTISTHHKGEWSCSLWQEGCRAVLTIRYLHELENFVYMTLYKELIEE